MIRTTFRQTQSAASEPSAAAFGQARDERQSALRQARRRLILDAAQQVFVKDGLEGATVRAIAAAAGCTTGALYPLFESKEAIYAALLYESLSRLHVAVSDAVASGRTPQAALRAGALAFLDYYRERPDEVALGLYLWGSVRPRGLSPALDAGLNQRLADTLGLLEDTIRQTSRRGAATARTETAALFAFLIGAVVTHQTGRLRVLSRDLDGIARSHLDALIDRLRRR
ncbi:MAG: TetR family transcriptional regulator [Rhizobiales bacterium]|nr:TetR family transcriptional regulator [Hyphomicrobiales bacterium]